jgi:hypothetical protein
MDKTIVVALIAGVPGLVAAYLVYRSSSRANELGWAKELRQDASDARREVQQLRDEVRDLRRQLLLAQGEADHWISEHQSMRRQAWRAGMTMERFRDLIGPVDPPAAAAGGR